MGRYKKTEWSGKYQKILIYAEQGMSKKDIAAKVGMNVKSVYRAMTSDKFTKRKEDFEDKIATKARAVFEEHAIQAAKKIVSIAKGGKAEDRIRFDASKEVLYQVGVKPVEVIETRKREYTPEEILSALGTVKELEAVIDRITDKDSQFVLPVTETRGDEVDATIIPTSTD